MPQERLSMRKIREILRLKKEMELSDRAIARACRVSNSTVGEYLERAERAGVSWPLPVEWSERELQEKLFPEKSGAGKAERPLPNWEQVRQELARRGVTLLLLWEEYREQHPDGYGRTQFFEHYQRWSRARNSSLRQQHKGGEVMEVDYAGMTIQITDPLTGAISQAEIFVAALPASSYVYAEAQPSQELQHWLGGHVRAFEFFGGAPKILRPDNLKSGVTKPNYYEPDLNPSYQELAEYYRVAVLPARVRKPKDKAHAENSVQNVERRVLAPLRNRTFFSVAEVNRAMQPLLEALNQREMTQWKKSRQRLFEEVDQPTLQPLPAQPYEFARWKNARVNPDYHVAFEGHFYSVPHTLIGQEVHLRATERLITVFHDSQQVALHPRNAVVGGSSTCREHAPAHHRFVLELDADYLLREAEKVGAQMTAYIAATLAASAQPEQVFRVCLGMLDLARKHPPELLEAACQQLLPLQLLTYKDLKAEVERRAKKIPSQPLPAHEHVRGSAYYH